MDLMWVIIVFVSIIILILFAFLVTNQLLLTEVGNKIDSQVSKDVVKGMFNFGSIITSVDNIMNSGSALMLSKVGAVTSNLKLIGSETRDVNNKIKKSFDELNLNLTSISKTQMFDFNLPLSKECMLSEQCLVSYLRTKLNAQDYTYANMVTKKGSATEVSLLSTKRVYFSNSSYYQDFFMPAGVDSELLFIEVRSTMPVIVNMSRTDLANNLNVATNSIAVFIYKDSKWCFITILSVSKLS